MCAVAGFALSVLLILFLPTGTGRNKGRDNAISAGVDIYGRWGSCFSKGGGSLNLAVVGGKVHCGHGREERSFRGQYGNCATGGDSLYCGREVGNCFQMEGKFYCGIAGKGARCVMVGKRVYCGEGVGQCVTVGEQIHCGKP